MTTARLREELERLGESAPVADVPADTWARARRARQRDRALTLAAAAAALAVVGGLVAWLPQRDVPPAAGADGALPSRVWQLPADVEDAPGDPERAAVAYKDAAAVSDLVVVSADDGAYHRVDLPGFAGSVPHLTEFAAPPLLSPDGTLVAYPSVENLPPPGSPGLASTGVRVVRLADGQTWETTLTDGKGVVVATLAWSSDSDQLLWTGHGTRRLNSSSASFGNRTLAGLASSGGTAPLPSRGGPASRQASYAVDEAGQVAMFTDRGRTAPYPDVRGPTAPNPVPGTWAYSSTFHDDRWGALLVGQGDDAQRVEELAALVDGSVTHAPLPEQLENRWVTPVGWPAADRLVMIDRTEQGTGPGRLVQVTLDDAATSLQELVDLPDGVLTGLSIATDLVAADAATRDTPAPPWEDDDAPWGWWVGGLVALALAAVAVIAGRRAR